LMVFLSGGYVPLVWGDNALIMGNVRMTLTGRVALVTGAGSGIGKARALALAAAGAAVVAADINAAAAASTAEAITQGLRWCGRRSCRLVKSTS
jgi:S-adenosylhomocysteine hydrolase